MILSLEFIVAPEVGLRKPWERSRRELRLASLSTLTLGFRNSLTVAPVDCCITQVPFRSIFPIDRPPLRTMS